MDHAARVAAATSRSTRQRALVRERTQRKRRRAGARRVRWFSSAEIAAQPMISADYSR
jgi:hypothetical protein